MSPALQTVFMAEIAPRIMATVPRLVSPVGVEDEQELVQDTLADACKAAASLERRGEPVIPSSVAFYAIQRARCGRRSMSNGKTDVFSVGACLNGRAEVASMDAVVADDDGGNEDQTVHDLLACRRPDPATLAQQRLDWADFLETLKPAQRYVVCATAAGVSGQVQARELAVSPARVVQLKREVAKAATRFWGEHVLEDASARPLWWRSCRHW